MESKKLEKIIKSGKFGGYSLLNLIGGTILGIGISAGTLTYATNHARQKAEKAGVIARATQTMLPYGFSSPKTRAGLTAYNDLTPKNIKDSYTYSGTLVGAGLLASIFSLNRIRKLNKTKTLSRQK